MILTYEDMYKIHNYWQSPNTIARKRKREKDKELRDKQYRNTYLRNRIQRVKFDNPWTIVWWKDGSITRVKCSNLDTFTEESGLMAAICKHYYEDTNIFGEMLHKWCKPTPREVQPTLMRPMTQDIMMAILLGMTMVIVMVVQSSTMKRMMKIGLQGTIVVMSKAIVTAKLYNETSMS